MTIYMAVSSDKYELPLYCTPYLMELAQKFGVTEKRVNWEVSSTRAQANINGKQRGYRFTRVEVEND